MPLPRSRRKPRAHVLVTAAVLAGAVAGGAVPAHGGERAGPRKSFRADTARLAAVPAELQKQLREDPHAYFRFLNTSWANAVCDAFREEIRELPTVVLHGDAHLEQYAVTADARGLDDFDDAGRGPSLIDIVRFLASLDVVLRQRGWLAGRERVFDEFFAAYRLALADPSYVPPEPAVAARLRETRRRTPEEFLAWADSLMQETTGGEREDALRSLRLVEQLARERRPETPAGFFELKRVGWLRMGVGSVLVRKALLRVEGPSAAADDDVLLEAKEVSRLGYVSCVRISPEGEATRVIEAARQIGRIRHAVLVVGPRRQEWAGVRDWWVHSWDGSYVELACAGLESADELAEVARDVGAQLGSANLREGEAALEAEWRRIELAAVTRLEPRIRATARRLVDELLASWEEWRRPR